MPVSASLQACLFYSCTDFLSTSQDISFRGELVVSDAYQGCVHVFDLGLLRQDHIRVPPSRFSQRMAGLLQSGTNADVFFEVSRPPG